MGLGTAVTVTDDSFVHDGCSGRIAVVTPLTVTIDTRNGEERTEIDAAAP